MRLLIAIPIHNERRYVERVLAKVRSFHRDVLVVDDGSTDGTQDVLERLARRRQIHLVRHAGNLGYGQSIIDAFDFADAGGYDWVLTMDCDEQHEPEHIPDFIRAARTDRWDLVSGSRYLLPSREDDLPPGDRRTINAAITAIVNDLFDLNLTDAFCGFKAHRVSAARALRLSEPGYAFPLQLWPRVARQGQRVTEIPVRLIYNDPSRHFGGKLDDAHYRMEHYLDVLRRELADGTPLPEAAEALRAARVAGMVGAAARGGGAPELTEPPASGSLPVAAAAPDPCLGRAGDVLPCCCGD